jgi:hypothetical protein
MNDMTLYNDIKAVKRIVTDILNGYDNGKTLLEMMDSNSLLSVTNFKELKDKIIEEKLLDLLNSVLIVYAVCRIDILEKLEKALPDMYYLDKDKMVDTEIIRYDTLSEPDKRLFELTLIVNIM